MMEDDNALKSDKDTNINKLFNIFFNPNSKPLETKNFSTLGIHRATADVVITRICFGVELRVDKTTPELLLLFHKFCSGF